MKLLTHLVLIFTLLISSLSLAQVEGQTGARSGSSGPDSTKPCSDDKANPLVTYSADRAMTATSGGTKAAHLLDKDGKPIPQSEADGQH